jgi:RNA polymerase subunit RPABC4/transcription elongation factor Spt4
MGEKVCPKCGSELPLKEGWDSIVYHCKNCHIIIDADTGETCEIVHLETLYERG